MANNLAQKQGKVSNAVWIELSRPTSPENGKEVAERASKMLHKLGIDSEYKFTYSERERRYCWGGPYGYEVLSDWGKWFNLDFLGK